jgi:hypothetical protein
VLRNLPVPQDTRWDLPQRAGVANEDGHVYRDIVVCNAFELLQLTARLNAAGFSVSPALLHVRLGRYDRVFAKARPGRQPHGG